MLKKMVKVMVATIMARIRHAVYNSKMETAKTELINELNECIEDVNNDLKEKGLDESNYYVELKGTEEHCDGDIIYSVVNFVLNGDTYTTVCYYIYDYKTESYGRNLLALYSEPDNKWFSTDDSLGDIINERYPECQ